MKPLLRLTVHMRCTTAILAPILASAVHAQEFSALQARFNVLTQVGNHITNANVVESQTQISHGYVTEKSTYFFPNHFSSTNFPSISNIKIDGSAPIFFATHQLVDKGVSTAPFVELFFRTHNFSGASAIQSAMLSPHNEGTIEELNLLNYAQNWSVTELNQSRFANASKLEYWLKFTLPNGTVRWDSNDGKNYWVEILPPQGYVATIQTNGSVLVSKNITNENSPKSLRILYLLNYHKECRLSGFVSFDTSNTEHIPLAINAFNFEGERILVEGVVSVPENAKLAKIHFEPAEYNYACPIKRDPYSAQESYNIPLL